MMNEALEGKMISADDAQAEIEKLCTILKKLHLSSMAEELKKQSNDPNADLKSFMERLDDIVMSEWNTRATKKFQRLLKKSHLKYPGAFFDSSIEDPKRNLDTDTMNRITGNTVWVDGGRNLLITGMCGSGKTFWACALGVLVMHQNRSVRYTKASLLMNEIARTQTNGDPEIFHKELEALSNVDLLIIDDFGMMNLDIEMCRNLFEILDAREGRKSTVVISQMPVKDWYDLFKDSSYADACLDRLTSKAYRLEFNGIDMRNSE